MRANTHIGEASVQVDGTVFMFRPTLANIADIGTPAEIVEVFALIMAEPFSDEHRWYQLGAATAVLYHCCDDFTPDLERLLGQWIDSCPRRYTPGRLPTPALIGIARQMMRHGVVGVPLTERAEQPIVSGDDYTPEFKAAEMVATVVAHLGLSTDDAWRMTMTSVVQTLAAKFPPDKSKTVTPRDLERSDKTKHWLKRVNEQRKKEARNG